MTVQTLNLAKSEKWPWKITQGQKDHVWLPTSGHYSNHLTLFPFQLIYELTAYMTANDLEKFFSSVMRVKIIVCLLVTES